MINDSHEQKIQNILKYIILDNDLEIEEDLLDEYIDNLSIKPAEKEELRKHVLKSVVEFTKHDNKNVKMLERFIASGILTYLYFFMLLFVRKSRTIVVQLLLLSKAEVTCWCSRSG